MLASQRLRRTLGLALALAPAAILVGLPRTAAAAWQAPQEGALRRALERAARIPEGDAGERRRELCRVFFDARCPACAALYRATRSALRSGRLGIDWIPVALLGAESLRLGAQLLAADSPARSLELALEGDRRRHLLPGASQTRVVAVQANTALLRWAAGPRPATPTLILPGQDGQEFVSVGYAPAWISAWWVRP
jgi:hypothetical protein